MRSVLDLYRHANTAAADASRWARQPNGLRMAFMRRRDAAQLRAMARAILTGERADHR